MISSWLAAGRLPGTFSWTCGNNRGPASHLVIQTDKGNVYFHQPFKEGHLQMEILGQIIHVGTGAQLKRETCLRTLLKKYFNYPFTHLPIKCFSSAFCVPGIALGAERLRIKSKKGPEGNKWGDVTKCPEVRLL